MGRETANHGGGFTISYPGSSDRNKSLHPGTGVTDHRRAWCRDILNTALPTVRSEKSDTAKRRGISNEVCST